MAAGWAAATAAVMLAAVQLAAAAAPATAPAFLWAPEDYGFSSDGAKEVVDYQTISPKGLAKSVLEKGGWSNLVCSGTSGRKHVDVAVIFLGSKLHLSDISKDKQGDPALVDTLKLSFTSSNFSMAFPYVAMSDDDILNSLLSGFTENCNNGFGPNRIGYTDTCHPSDEPPIKLTNLDAINDFVRSEMSNWPRQTDLIVFCRGSLSKYAKSEGELLSKLVEVLSALKAKYTILYASQPYGSLEDPSDLPLGRYLAEKATDTSAALGKCDGTCLVKSTLLEGSFVGIVLLIILISGLKCMMGIDSPSRFEELQES